jgi:large subunit ribosomal protein L19
MRVKSKNIKVPLEGKVDLIKQIEKGYIREAAKTEFSAGDTITVNYRIQEGSKTRIQKYTGVVIQRKNGTGMSATFTVRKASANGVFVERIFALNSPLIEAVVVETKGRVRRARIFYLRERTGKSARIKELKTVGGSATAVAQEPQAAPVKAAVAATVATVAEAPIAAETPTVVETPAVEAVAATPAADTAAETAPATEATKTEEKTATAAE